MLRKVIRDEIVNIKGKPIVGVYDDGKFKQECSIIGILPSNIFGYEGVITMTSNKDKIWWNVFDTKDILDNFYVVV